jgi:1-acyl-sn-glycerol-3-phosphate acyltransferase
MHLLAKFIFFKLMGWRLEGKMPPLKKCIIIVIPHTHWQDFTLGLVVRSVLNVPINYIGKKSLFKPPFGWFFRWMGGAPIDRSTSSNTVEAVSNIFKEREEFRLALAPEGTRKKVTDLKTGFYYMAIAAEVPLVMVAFDFGKKRVKIAEPFTPSGNYEADLPRLRAFYKDVRGKVAECSWSDSSE